MNILGISGLERAMDFKKAHWPGLDEREYRISQGHDAAAALVVDGVTVAAAAEERFNRRKHSARFPSAAIGYCLAQAGLGLDDIDLVAHSFDYTPYDKAYAIDPETAAFYRQVCSR
jgi:carbamoyltransferase